jgi:hypothetical protein
MLIIVGPTGLYRAGTVAVLLTFWGCIAVTFLPWKRSALVRNLQNSRTRSWSGYERLAGTVFSLTTTNP